MVRRKAVGNVDNCIRAENQMDLLQSIGYFRTDSRRSLCNLPYMRVYLGIARKVELVYLGSSVGSPRQRVLVMVRFCRICAVEYRASKTRTTRNRCDNAEQNHQRFWAEGTIIRTALGRQLIAPWELWGSPPPNKELGRCPAPNTLIVGPVGLEPTLART